MPLLVEQLQREIFVDARHTPYLEMASEQVPEGRLAGRQATNV
jgi:hypothetical protein